jgi:hypothetical protein
LRAFQWCVVLRLKTPGSGWFLTFLKNWIKLPVWLLALLSHITSIANVGMAHARPFSTSMLQELSNGIKNTSRRGVLTPAIELKSPFWECECHPHTPSKWGCDNRHYLGSFIAKLVDWSCIWSKHVCGENREKICAIKQNMRHWFYFFLLLWFNEGLLLLHMLH